MNIFVLDKNPQQAAQYHCDKHVIKMILESAQMISTVMSHYGQPAPYKPVHPHHPCTLWARRDVHNLLWLYDLAKFLNEEYKLRYGNGPHKSWLAIRGMTLPPAMPFKALSPFVQAMPPTYRDENPVVAYRTYYIFEKARFATWRVRGEPYWWQTIEAGA